MMKLEWFKWKVLGRGKKRRRQSKVNKIPNSFQDEPIYEEIDFDFKDPRAASKSGNFQISKEIEADISKTFSTRPKESASSYVGMFENSCAEESSSFYFPMGPIKSSKRKVDAEHTYYTIEASKNTVKCHARPLPSVFPELDHQPRNIFPTLDTELGYSFPGLTNRSTDLLSELDQQPANPLLKLNQQPTNELRELDHQQTSAHGSDTYSSAFQSSAISDTTKKKCLPEGYLEFCIDDLFLKKNRNRSPPSETKLDDTFALDHFLDLGCIPIDEVNGLVDSGRSVDKKGLNNDIIHHQGKKRSTITLFSSSGLSFKSDSGYGSTVSRDNDLYSNVDSDDDGYVYGDIFSAQEINLVHERVGVVENSDSQSIKKIQRKNGQIQKNSFYSGKLKDISARPRNPVFRSCEFLEGKARIPTDYFGQPMQNSTYVLRQGVLNKNCHSGFQSDDCEILRLKDKSSIVKSENGRYANFWNKGNILYQKASNTALNDLIWSNFKRRC